LIRFNKGVCTFFKRSRRQCRRATFTRWPPEDLLSFDVGKADQARLIPLFARIKKTVTAS
jgi:hypothetical protein